MRRQEQTSSAPTRKQQKCTSAPVIDNTKNYVSPSKEEAKTTSVPTRKQLHLLNNNKNAACLGVCSYILDSDVTIYHTVPRIY